LCFVTWLSQIVEYNECVDNILPYSFSTEFSTYYNTIPLWKG